MSRCVDVTHLICCYKLHGWRRNRRKSFKKGIFSSELARMFPLHKTSQVIGIDFKNQAKALWMCLRWNLLKNSLRRIKIFRISAWIKVKFLFSEIILHRFPRSQPRLVPSSPWKMKNLDLLSSNDNFLIMLKFINVYKFYFHPGRWRWMENVLGDVRSWRQSGLDVIKV